MPAPLRKILTEADIAALQATGSLPGDPLAPTAAELAATAAATAAAAAVTAAAQAAANGGAENVVATPTAEQIAAAQAVIDAGTAAAAAATAAAATTQTTPSAAEAGVTAYLQGQIAAKDAALLTATVENTGLKGELAEMKASMAGLTAIAAKSMNSMRIALGGTSQDYSALTPVQLLAQHDAAQKDFQTKFVAGGVAAVDAAQASKPVANAQTSLQAARLRAVNGK